MTTEVPMGAMMVVFVVAEINCAGLLNRVESKPTPEKVLLADLKVGATTRALSFSSNGDLVAAGNAQDNDDKYVVMCWDVERKKLKTSIKTEFETFITSVDVSPNGETILAADIDAL